MNARLTSWLLATGVLLAGLACIQKDPSLSPPDDDTADDCPEPFTDPMTEVYDEPYNPDGIYREHDPSVDGELCFDCHLCANGDALPIDNTHFVCKHCHDESGGVIDAEGCLCGDLDCEVDPPVLTCNECHTDGCNGYASADQMNALCDFCHVPVGGDR